MKEQSRNSIRLQQKNRFSPLENLEDNVDINRAWDLLEII
jgi:hypothetical protein